MMSQGRLHFLILCCVVFVLCISPFVDAQNIPRPYINPLPSYDDYFYVEYHPMEDQLSATEFGWEEGDGEEIVFYLWGNHWIMAVEELSLDGLREHLAELDANIVYDDGEFLIANVDGPDGVWWACATMIAGRYYGVTVVQELEPPELPQEDDFACEDEYYEDEYYEDEFYDDEYYEEYAEIYPPLINPLGDIEAYPYADYVPGGNVDMWFDDADGEQFTFFGWGEKWTFAVPVEDQDPLAGLARHIQDLGGEIVEHSRGVLIGKLMDSDGYLWTAIARFFGEDTYILTVVKELFLVPGQTLTLGPAPGRTIGFVTESDGSRFRSLSVEIQGGECILTAATMNNYGVYSRRWSQDYRVEYVKTPRYIIDYINQEPGKTVFELHRLQESMPEQISITLEESVPLKPPKMGEQLGVLKVFGAGSADVSVWPTLGVDYTHPEVEELVGDLAQDGAYVFYLPAGYWDVTARIPSYPAAVSRMVPVSSGEITVLHIPSASLDIVELVENVEQDDSLELIRHVVKDGQGQVDFKLAKNFPEHLVPGVENLEVSEGGLPGEVLSVEPLTSPPEIVLLLDSSGSMRPQMEQTLETARQFISSLDDDTFIQVVDFDTTPKPLEGTTKEEVLASLAGVRADGATCLYDSIMTGLRLLEDKSRPVLLVFTDGVDANWDDTGPGSAATLPEVIAAVQASQVPLHTIGFGAGHDKTVLQQLAEISGGKYFPAADQTALNQVFASINQTLSGNYRVVYERPKEPRISNVPVVSLMIDTSGSMDMDPENEGCGWRIQKVKNVLHDFILGLPDQTLVQVADFNWFTEIKQILTLDKAQALHAVGGLEAMGATDIEGSIGLAYQTLSATPSQNKILVYITDIGITTDIDLDLYYWLMGCIAKSDIKAIWVGIGVEDAEAAFAEAAQRSKGRYLVTKDAQEISTILEQVLAEVKTAAEDTGEVAVRVAVKDSPAPQLVQHYAGTLDVPAVKFALGDTVIEPVASEFYSAGSAAGAGEIMSYGLASADLQTRFIPLDVQASNKAVQVKVSGVTVGNHIAGLRAPVDYQFVSVDVTVENILEAQEVVVDSKGNSHPASWMGGGGGSGKVEYRVPDYLIPSLSSHLYLGRNNHSMYPVSRAGWLAPDSLLAPGDMSLTVKAGEPLSGTLVFLVDRQQLSQASLHFYDTAYGHFHLDLIGASTLPQFELETYPAEEPTRLSDAFTLQITAVEDLAQIGSVAAVDPLNIFRVVEFSLASKVQALLDIDPQEVFSLRIHTGKGHFFIPVSLEATMSMPLGFGDARMVAPGSFNILRLVFEVPQALAENPCELFVDMSRDDLFIPLAAGEIALDLTAEPVSAEGIELYVNQIGRSPAGTAALGGGHVVADVTFADYPDDVGTVLEGCFKLVRDDYAGEESGFDMAQLVESRGLGGLTDYSGEVLYVVGPDAATEQLVLGFGDAVVKDGMARRALVVFRIPPGGEDHEWTLKSDLFPDLNVPVPDLEYADAGLLGAKTRAKVDYGITDFSQKLEAAIYAKIRAYQEEQAVKGQLARQDQYDLEGTVEQEEQIPPPRTNIAGALLLEETASLDELLGLLAELRWVPGRDPLGFWMPRYAPEAVLTQQWGTEADLANLALAVLDRLGYQPERAIVDIKPAGLEALAELSSVAADSIRTEHLPAVKYQDGGEARLLVIPFMADYTELEDYVALPIRRVVFETKPAEAVVEVILSVIPRGSGFGDQFADFATVFAGGEEGDSEEPYTLLYTTLPLTDLSLDPIDLVYVHAGYDGGDLYTVIVETASGRIVGGDINTADYEIKAVEIRITEGYNYYRHRMELKENQPLDEIAQTIAINSPDLPAEAAVKLQEVADALYAGAANPDSQSVFKWYTRSIINRFVTGQTQAEQGLADRLGLVIGRSARPRVIIVTVAKDPVRLTFRTGIDLAGAANDVHSGEPEAIAAFNLGSGLAATALEAEALGGIGAFELFQDLPEDVPVLWIHESNKDLALGILQEAGFSGSIQKHIEELENKVVFFPLATFLRDGIPEAAWLEIDCDTFFAIGVLAGGGHGAMLESAIMNYAKEAGKYVVGAIVGMETMVWGVSGYALVYGDYGEILQAAAAEVTAIAQAVKKGLEDVSKWNPNKAAQIMAKVESKFMAYHDASIPDAVKTEVKEWITGKAKGWIDEKKNELKDELLPDLSFTGGMLDAIALYIQVAQ